MTSLYRDDFSDLELTELDLQIPFIKNDKANKDPSQEMQGNEGWRGSWQHVC